MDIEIKQAPEWHPFDLFNERNGKKLALVLVVILVSCHIARNKMKPYDSCATLLDDGTYLGPGAWQPTGCTIHHYTIRDAPKCLKEKRVIIIGDSRMRELFYSLVKTAGVQNIEEGKRHADIVHHEEDINTDFEFWWQPELNDSTIDAYRSGILEAEKKPVFVVHGVATWTIKLNDASEEAFQQFQANLTKAVPVMKETAQLTTLLWMLQAPVQHDLLIEARKMITNKQVDLYNSAAETILQDSGVHFWHTARSAALSDKTLDGLHLSAETIGTVVQLLLNRFCNSAVNPTDANCCSKPPPPMTLLQQLTFGFFFTNFILAIFLKYQSHRRRSLLASSEPNNVNVEAANPVSVEAANPVNVGAANPVSVGAANPVNVGAANHVSVGAANHVTVSKSPPPKPEPHWVDRAYTCTSCLARYGLLMVYFYLCDRTDLFPKRQKYYSSFYFFFSIGVAFLMSLFFYADTKKPSVLNLDQTKEWKGWMQIGILIYHYLGASKVIPIYMHLRLMVASYLFMTAYGQFCASWDKNKFGLARVCNVLFRMNLLVFFLCLVMDRQYQLYYFVPLVSFWFLVIYTTMAIFPRVTRESAQEKSRHYIFMLGKLLCLFLVITFLAVSQMTFNLVFEWWPFNQLFTWPGDSLYEWWFRWNLDRYIIPYGMVFGFGLLSARSFKYLDDGSGKNLFSPPVTIMVNIIAAAALLLCSYHSYLCTNKPDCNKFHAYTSFIPVTAFIILRNTSGFLRRKFSVFAAWFGEISLELFISQYHIWLAQDTKTLLVLIPGIPTLNLVVMSFIFVCVAIELKDITGTLTALAVPSEPRKLYIRLTMFAGLLAFLLVYTNFSN